MSYNIPKGTKDILPSESYKWQWLEKRCRETAAKYGYREYRTPIFEHTELFARGIGDTTDVVQKEMYSFEIAGRSLTLKPEGTAGVARSYIENKVYADPQPGKYYYITPCFRYEKMQKGRQRQFHQFGIECYGSNSMLADAEVIAMGWDLLSGFGIENLSLRINSIGCPQCRKAYRKALQDFLKPNYDNFCETCKGRFEKNPMRILDCKSPECQKYVEGAPRMLDYLCEDCSKAFEDLKDNLTAMGIPYEVDPGIVRGLDYYTKTAFEFVSSDLGAQSTVCGGGRYDHLVEELEGPDTPAVGFGMGLERLLLILEAKGFEFPSPKAPDVFVATMGERAKKEGLHIIADLRRKGLSVVNDIMERGLKAQLKYADRSGAAYAVVIGDDELDRGEVALRDMKNSTQRDVKIESLYEEISGQGK